MDAVNIQYLQVKLIWALVFQRYKILKKKYFWSTFGEIKNKNICGHCTNTKKSAYLLCPSSIQDLEQNIAGHPGQGNQVTSSLQQFQQLLRILRMINLDQMGRMRRCRFLRIFTYKDDGLL